MYEKNIIRNYHNIMGVLSEMFKSKTNIYNTDLNRINFLVITNGSGSIEDYRKLVDNGFSLAISRHHFNNQINENIFHGNGMIDGSSCCGLHSKKESQVMRKKQQFYANHKLPYLNQEEGLVLFYANLLKDGLSSIQDVADYLYWVASLESNPGAAAPMKVVFSNLQNSNSLGNKEIENYDEIKINEDLVELFDEWFTRGPSHLVISSSGYTLTEYLFDNNKKGHKSLKFYLKQYLTKEELKKEWKERYPRRRIDLSMDPSGTIYTDYSEKKKLIIK